MASFRRFRPEDVNRFSRCNLDSLTETYDSSFYLQYHAKWPGMFFVAEDGQGNIVGYIMGKLESSPEYFRYSEHFLPWHAHITALTVAPEYRGFGIGKILVQQLEDAANVGNAFFMDLFVRKSNTRAINLYKKLGYSVFRVVKSYYADNISDPTANGEDAYDMRKSMKRDVKGEHVRANGEKHEVSKKLVDAAIPRSQYPTPRHRIACGPNYKVSVPQWVWQGTYHNNVPVLYPNLMYLSWAGSGQWNDAAEED